MRTDQFGIPIEEDFSEIDGEKWKIFQNVHLTKTGAIIKVTLYPRSKDKLPMGVPIGTSSFELKNGKLSKIFSKSIDPQFEKVMSKYAEMVVKDHKLSETTDQFGVPEEEEKIECSRCGRIVSVDDVEGVGLDAICDMCRYDMSPDVEESSDKKYDASVKGAFDMLNKGKGWIPEDQDTENQENMGDMGNMEDWFKYRTNLHIGLVRKYLDKIIGLDLPELNMETLVAEKDHDASKLVDPERDPYVHVSWKYRMKDQGKEYKPPADTEAKMREATLHHVLNNKHHPESWADSITSDSINPKDRDATPEKIVDATKMPIDYVASMVADWMAMSEEKGTSIHDWIKKNVNIRWKFTPTQVALIDKLVDKVQIETNQMESVQVESPQNEFVPIKKIQRALTPTVKKLMSTGKYTSPEFRTNRGGLILTVDSDSKYGIVWDGDYSKWDSEKLDSSLVKPGDKVDLVYFFDDGEGNIAGDIRLDTATMMVRDEKEPVHEHVDQFGVPIDF
jgi:hypothetical protein